VLHVERTEEKEAVLLAEMVVAGGDLRGHAYKSRGGGTHLTLGRVRRMQFSCHAGRELGPHCRGRKSGPPVVMLDSLGGGRHTIREL
jgi:hypothetical protein